MRAMLANGRRDAGEWAAVWAITRTRWPRAHLVFARFSRLAFSLCSLRAAICDASDMFASVEKRFLPAPELMDYLLSFARSRLQGMRTVLRFADGAWATDAEQF